MTKSSPFFFFFFFFFKKNTLGRSVPLLNTFLSRGGVWCGGVKGAMAILQV